MFDINNNSMTLTLSKSIICLHSFFAFYYVFAVIRCRILFQILNEYEFLREIAVFFYFYIWHLFVVHLKVVAKQTFRQL